jgi:outer membrane usher protein
MLLQAQISKAIPWHGSISAGFLRRDGRTEDNVRVLTASLNVRAGRGFITLGSTYSLRDPGVYGVTVSYLLPLGDRRLASTSVQAGPNGTTAAMEVSRPLPVGPGYGYRVRNSLFDQRRTEANFFLQTMQGTYGVEAAQAAGQTAVQVSERGSLVLLHNHVKRSQWLNDSFGIVEVEGGADVPVYVNNQMLAKTDEDGIALIPWLVPYNENRVRLDGTALPFEVNIDLQERTVVPMPRTGVFLRYQPTSVGGATLILVYPDGTPLPHGAMVHINRQAAGYMVALRGTVFIQEITYPAAIQVDWEGRRCTTQIDERPAELLPIIGPLVCKLEEVGP